MELLPIAEAAELVGTDVATLREQMREGRLMEYRQSGRLFANKEELLAVFAQKRLSNKQKAEGPRIIAVANQKGGTGKTTTTSSLGYLLAQRGPTLLIDADPQGNMTQSFGLQPDALESTLYEVLVNGRPIDQIIQTLAAPLENISIIGSNLDLAQTTLQVSGRPTWATLLRNALAPVRSRYKYILIDCPPNLDALTVNALVAATEMIVPVEMGAFSLRGTSRLLDVIRDLQVLNPSLLAPRFLACRVKAHTRLSAQIQQDMGAGFAEQVFKTYIREGTVVGQAQYAKMPLAVYAPSSGPAQDYTMLCKELLCEMLPVEEPAMDTQLSAAVKEIRSDKRAKAEKAAEVAMPRAEKAVEVTMPKAEKPAEVPMPKAEPVAIAPVMPDLAVVSMPAMPNMTVVAEPIANGKTNGNGHSNGNGKHANGNGNGHSNGNGNGHSNGNGKHENGNGNSHSNGNGNGKHVEAVAIVATEKPIPEPVAMTAAAPMTATTQSDPKPTVNGAMEGKAVVKEIAGTKQGRKFEKILR